MTIKTKLLFITISGIIILYFAIPPAPLLKDISFSQRVFDRSGELMRISLSKDDKYRIFTPIREIPASFIEAVLLYEDRHFYKHCGINPISLAKAFYYTYLQNNRKIGGSTITMQIARLRYGINSSTILGKIHQIIKAIHVELHYSKNEILEAYLNLVPYGSNIEGITASSYIYFNRDLKDLNLLDILSLAVIPQNPLKRGGNDMNIFQARKYLFTEWLTTHPQDIIYNKLISLPIKFNQNKNLPFIAPHFTLDILANNDSPIIRTTIDKNLQTTIEKQVQLYINNLKKYGINNASVILIDFTTMEVLASVGSGDFFNNDICGQINGTKSHRSPGSALKPFVYALSFDQSLIHPLTLLKDTPTYYDHYKPENFDSRFTGGLSVRESLIRSRNVPVIFLASKLKNPNFYEFLQQAKISGLQKPEHYGLSIVLGTAEITLEELTTLYAMLANFGTYKPLRKMLSTSLHGEAQRGRGTLEQNNTNSTRLPRSEQMLATTMISPEASYLTLDIIKDTTRPITYNNTKHNLPIYWKTGTSSSFRDALSIGIFSKYVLAVWVGDFKGQTHGTFTGNISAAPLFFNIIESIAEPNKDKDLILSKINKLNITKVKVCADTGDIDNDMCPLKAESLFIKGKSPIKQSGIYRKMLIDLKTGMPACHFIQGQTEYKTVNLWPADMISVYQKAGIHILPKPIPTNHCNRLINWHHQKPKIIYPLRNSIHSIKDSDNITFSAISDNKTNNIFWFVDNELIATAKSNEPVIWKAKTGEFIIRAISDSGENDSIKIYIKE
ncbi:bifunctional penicillin-binding protein 1C [Rickettsia akari str. Hartford]|uniref:peptidoglycan glycosyltransferase n=1 Tax=Rickettsia akari (strain Hartford) TaxID=293614 RepID=A8GMH5_RICAH|nr:penicillin-binding protein 1C [Rickettsia akari]ABV74600.1 bifunctional penicillin-binding protein 1C [Rickettsia akari str. Hartford]